MIAGCTKGANSKENIHKRVHCVYYDPESYSAKCNVSAYTKGGKSEYECDVEYDKEKNLYTVTSEDMKISIGEKSTLISRGENSPFSALSLVISR